MQASISQDVLTDIIDSVENVEGWLSKREIRFLATAAANPTAEGCILEVGCFKGKSTVVLAKAKRSTDPCRLITVDPLFNNIRGELDQNLDHCGVRDEIEIHEMASQQLLESWDQPIRLLFHDGSNKTEDVQLDIRLAREHLADGAIVALHDVLNTSGERAEVFVNEVLGSDCFGPVGCCGSIGWGQYITDPDVCQRYRDQKAWFRERLTSLLPFLGKPLTSLQVLHYKLLRSRIPHHQIDSAKWLRSAA